MSPTEYGAGFIGLIIGAVMFGMTILQANTYFHKFQNDGLWLRASVALLCILDALHLCFSVDMMYFDIIRNFGDAAAPANQNIWSLKGLAIVQVAVILLVQSMYLLRIWKLSRSIVTNTKISSALLAALVVISLLAFGIGITFVFEIGQLEEDISIASFRWAIVLAFSVTILIDLCIAGIMSVLLYRSRPGVQRTDSMLYTLIQYIIGTGLLTTIASIIYVVLYIVKPDTFLYLAQEFSITRLYVNSFLAMMNARDRLRDRLSVPMELDINFSNAMRFGSPSTTFPSVEDASKSFQIPHEAPTTILMSPPPSSAISDCHNETSPIQAPGLNV